MAGNYWRWERWSPEDDGYNLYSPGKIGCCAQIVPDEKSDYELTFCHPDLEHRRYVGPLKAMMSLGIKFMKTHRECL